MKTKLLISLCLVLTLSKGTLNAQEQNICGQSIVTESILNKDPKLRETYRKFMEQEKYTAGNTALKISATPAYTIPMVFHILHLGGVENISDAQVIDQVAILNRDYQKQNADTNLIVPSFTNNIANVGIAFKLATIDPDGNCTNGIIRHYTTSTNWDANNFSLFAYTWPRDKYLNIYVIKTMNITATAYAFLPGTPIPASADVIVSMHQMIGSVGTGNVANSRVITHEVAHWLNLQHIWGTSNQPGVACGDDAVGDTPITKGFVTCSTANAAVCSPTIQENVQNYMDYSPCKIMFTNGQAARMIACLTGTVNNRQNVFSPANLLATGVTTILSNCSPSIEIAVAPSKTVCSGKTISINSYTSNAVPTSYAWTASNGAVVSNSATPNATVTFVNAGNSTVTCVASNANGSSTSSLVITAVNGLANTQGSYSESFESMTMPLNWTVLNQTSPTALWAKNNLAASLGAESMYVNAEYAPGASIEILETPSYDFLNNQGAAFTFKYAYARQTSTHKDVFKVQASKDCGGSWSDIYVPSPATMASGSGGVTSTLFVPSAAQWKQYDVTQHPAFSPFLTEENVKFRFYFREDSAGFGNRLFIDEVNFTSPVGINEFTKRIAFNFYPNPGKEQINISFLAHEPANIKITLWNALGQQLEEKKLGNVVPGRVEVNMNVEESLPRGIYLVKLEYNDLTSVKKWIKD